MTEVQETITRYKAFTGRVFMNKSDCEEFERLANKFGTQCHKDIPQVFDKDDRLQCFWVETEEDLDDYQEWLKTTHYHQIHFCTNNKQELIRHLPTMMTCYYNLIEDDFVIGTVRHYNEYMESLIEEVQSSQNALKNTYYCYL